MCANRSTYATVLHSRDFVLCLAGCPGPIGRVHSDAYLGLSRLEPVDELERNRPEAGLTKNGV